jgi:predicted metal-dependent HD superfamily phosphohydrolase
MDNKIILLSTQIPVYVSAIFNEHMKTAFVYHNLEHTRRVVKRAVEIATHYDLSKPDSFILHAASWFHDMGQLFTTPENHEQQSAVMMESFLLEHGIEQSIVKVVRECILATKIPHRPQTFLQEIICDADTYNLGTKEFLITDEQLKEEWRLRGIGVSPEWDRITLEFLKRHKFFTTYCREKLQQGKQDNIDVFTKRSEDINKSNQKSTMKWTLENFPLEMSDLAPNVREKAIEIANKLKQERHIKELSIVEEAIKRAEEWFLNMEG